MEENIEKIIKKVDAINDQLYTQSGASMILKERIEQIMKHNRFIEDDVVQNTNKELSQAAVRLIYDFSYIKADYDETKLLKLMIPKNWNAEIWDKMSEKSYKERLVIAGALIAAEIDRLNYIENDK